LYTFKEIAIMKKNKHTFNRLLIGFTAALLFATTCANAWNNVPAGQTTRVSVSSKGIQGNANSGGNQNGWDWDGLNAISADGRYVAFESDASTLVVGDKNRAKDVFVRDRLTGNTTRVSVSSTGLPGNSNSQSSAISANGRYVAFTSDASNLVAWDTNGFPDVFVHDCKTGETRLVSVSSAHEQGSAQSNSPVISADGRYVAFTSYADNLVAGDTNGFPDVFVRDLKTGKTTLVSVSSAGVQGSQSDAISADGRYVVFTSEINGEFSPTSVFVRDLKTRTTTVVNSRFGRNWGGRISADGRWVALTSRKFDRAAQAQLHDRVTGVTIGIVPGGGYLPGYFSHSDAISADGRYVTVVSGSPLVVPEDKCEPLGFDDVYLYDRETGKVTGISKITGDEACGYNGSPAISADGRYVAFTSSIDNLIKGDTNDAWDVFVRDRLLNTTSVADLQVTVTAKPVSVKKGQTAHYTLTVKNNGPDSANNVALTDIVSNGTVLSITPSQGTCSMAAISVCRLDSLVAGASASVAVNIKAEANPLTQQIIVSAAPKDNKPGNNAVKIRTSVKIKDHEDHEDHED
jgi:uncharacterized repeat protein (TIGR01451 family)